MTDYFAMDELIRLLGMEKLYTDPESFDELKKRILGGFDYVVPGFLYDYLHYKGDAGLEFAYRYAAADPDRTCRGIDIHYGYPYDTVVKGLAPISTDSTAPYYNVLLNGSEVPVPARFQCADVIPEITGNEKLLVQHFLFLSSLEGVSPSERTGRFLPGESELYVRFSGTLCMEPVHLAEDLPGTLFEYYGLEIETEIGTVPALIPKDRIEELPQMGACVSGTGILSLDVAIEHYAKKERPFHKDLYRRILPEAKETLYKNGFVPNRLNDLTVLEDCLKRNDYLRLFRCCSETVKVYHEGSDPVEVIRSALVDLIRNFIPSGTKNTVRMHILKCPEPSFTGLSCLRIGDGGGKAYIAAIDIDENGLISRLYLSGTDRCETGIDGEFHLITLLTRGMQGGARACAPLREILSDTCVYRSDRSQKRLFGPDAIVEHLESVSKKLDAYSRYCYEILPAESMLKTTENLPAIYQGRYCFEEYQGGKNLFYLTTIGFIRLDEEGSIAEILLSRDPAYVAEDGFRIDPGETRVLRSLPEKLRAVYGEDPLKAMRSRDLPKGCGPEIPVLTSSPT